MSDLDFIVDFHQGRIAMGSDWGAPSIDRYWRFKRNLTVVLGLPNVGKTTFALYMYFTAAIRSGQKLVVWSSENSVAELKIMLMESLMQQHFRDINLTKVKKLYDWLGTVVLFLNTESADAFDVIDRIPTDGVCAVLIDPYNGMRLNRDAVGIGSHNYHYEVLSAFRDFQKKHGVAVTICVHPVTEAQRRTHSGGELDGLQMPPRLSDVEEGGKFLNRCDDFVTVHRYVQHPISDERLKTLLWVNKVKVRLTGGEPTPIDRPVVVEFDPFKRRFIFDGVDILGDSIKRNES